MLKVQRRRCATCIYRPDTFFDLEKLEAQVRDPHMGFWGYRACHHVQSGTVCCRGFWDAHRDEFQLGQLAQRLNAVEFVDVDELTGPLGSRRVSPTSPRAGSTAELGSEGKRAARRRTGPR